MTSGLSRSEFRAYAYTLWARQMATDAAEHYASWKNRPEPGDDRDIYQGERLVLQNILCRTATDETSTIGEIGYLVAEEAVFIGRDTCEEVTDLTGDSARTYFAAKKTFAARFAKASRRRGSNQG